MLRNSYNNIKRYAAFICMIFTVLSGSSERLDSDNLVKVERKAFIDILMTNKQFVQNTKVSLSKFYNVEFAKEHESFRSFIDINVNDTNLRYAQVYILLFTVLGYCFNNFIRKNNIWRSTVF